ncbi:hypothetical protein EYS09_26180 [Streptomyces kasugaensis]|uniref:Uncharacterized protein n=1 Tax=Streptomyces kasugaensis TaxID=1946 RepID=A0A4Q9HPZ8_STRKA|nr:hypothetical protein [Streptomyces kasugaensis]TBO56765.1 hypothetical protein EYS09_26180 [Streptomyces kasugaensis]
MNRFDFMSSDDIKAEAGRLASETDQDTPQIITDAVHPAPHAQHGPELHHTPLAPITLRWGTDA